MPPTELRSSGLLPGTGPRHSRPVAGGIPPAASVRRKAARCGLDQPGRPSLAAGGETLPYTPTLPYPPAPAQRAPTVRAARGSAGPVGVTHGPGAGSGVPTSRPCAAASRRGAVGPSSSVTLDSDEDWCLCTTTPASASPLHGLPAFAVFDSDRTHHQSSSNQESPPSGTRHGADPDASATRTTLRGDGPGTRVSLRPTSRAPTGRPSTSTATPPASLGRLSHGPGARITPGSTYGTRAPGPARPPLPHVTPTKGQDVPNSHSRKGPLTVSVTAQLL